MSQAQQIVDALGGFDNIVEIEPCITRLRCELEDASVVDEAALKRAGAHGVLVTAVHPDAFGQAIAMCRSNGTIVFNGLPPGEFPAPIFDIVLRGITIRGSLVGTRQDMAEALDFYARGEVKAHVTACELDDVNEVFENMRNGKIAGRMSIKY